MQSPAGRSYEIRGMGMTEENLGKQLGILRKQQKISRKKLSEGLCRDSELALIEKGEGQAELFLLTALLERLGKSAEWLVCIVTAKEYEKLSALDEIEEALRFGRLKDARRTFEEYQRKNPASRNRYRHIFEERISGILALEEYEDSLRSRQKERCPAEAETERKEEALTGAEKQERKVNSCFPLMQCCGKVCDARGDKEKKGRDAATAEQMYSLEKLEAADLHFHAALDQTLPSAELYSPAMILRLDKGEKLLALFEIENILLCLYTRRRLQGGQKLLPLLEALYRCLCRNSQDDWLRGQYLAKTGMLLGELYLEKNDYCTCIKVHEYILHRNRNSGMMVCVLPLLDQLITAYQELRHKEKVEYYLVHKENFETVFQEYGLFPECMSKLYYHCQMQQYYMEGSLIVAERKHRGISQEKLIEGIYKNTESLSRVENGRTNCDRKKFYMLMKRLEIDRVRFNADIITDEYRAIELERELENHLARQQFEEAGHELYILEKLLDMEKKCNRQLVLGMKNEEALRRRKIPWEEALGTAVKLLELTYSMDTAEGSIRYSRVPFRNEMYLFNQICIILRAAGRGEEAAEMLKKMLRTYEAAAGKKRFHFKALYLCAENLCGLLERSDCPKEAERLADLLIRERLARGELAQIHRVFRIKAEASRKGEKGKAYAERILRQAYLLCEWGGYVKEGSDIMDLIKEEYT